VHAEIESLLAAPKQSLLGRVFETAPVGISIAADAKVLYANTGCARMWGYASPEAICGISFFHMIAPDCHAFVQQLWTGRQAGSEDPWSYEIRGIRPDGTTFPYRCTSIPVPVPNGARGNLAFLEDLTHAQDVEAELRMHREHLQFLIAQRFSAEDSAAEL
jgi:PAS domain S-box-containing protein